MTSHSFLPFRFSGVHYSDANSHELHHLILLRQLNSTHCTDTYIPHCHILFIYSQCVYSVLMMLFLRDFKLLSDVFTFLLMTEMSTSHTLNPQHCSQYFGVVMHCQADMFHTVESCSTAQT